MSNLADYDTSRNGFPVYTSETPPRVPANGNLWFKSSENTMYLYDGDSWVVVTTNVGSPSLSLIDLIDVDAVAPPQVGDVVQYDGTIFMVQPPIVDEGRY